MGTSRQTTESQLAKAKAALESRVRALKEKGVEAKAYKNDPKWRELDAHVRQIASRLTRIAEIETNNSEVVKHQEERQAKLAAEKAERKSGKPAKPKAEKEVAKKPKGDAKAEAKGAGKKEKPAKEKK